MTTWVPALLCVLGQAHTGSIEEEMRALSADLSLVVQVGDVGVLRDDYDPVFGLYFGWSP